MPLPDFTPDEQYLVSYIKSPLASTVSGFLIGYLVGAIFVAGFALYHESLELMGIALLVFCGFRIYEERYQSKWAPHWRSIITKYEAAALANEPSGCSHSAAPSQPDAASQSGRDQD